MICSRTNCNGDYQPTATEVDAERGTTTAFLRCSACGHETTQISYPAPTRKAEPAVWDLVIADMRLRDEKGRRVYGARLRPGNGRDALQDAYEEALDLAVYLKQALIERGPR